MDTQEKVSIQPRDWALISSISACVLLLAFNVSLLLRQHTMKKNLLTLQEREAERRSTVARLGMQEISRWQAEISAWPDLEEALESFKNGQYRSAIDPLDRAIEKYPQLCVAYYLRAIARHESGQTEEAIQDLSTYLDQVPSSTHGFLKRAEMHRLRENFPAALEDVKKALENRPDWVEAKTRLEELRKK